MGQARPYRNAVQSSGRAGLARASAAVELLECRRHLSAVVASTAMPETTASLGAGASFRGLMRFMPVVSSVKVSSVAFEAVPENEVVGPKRPVVAGPAKLVTPVVPPPLAGALTGRVIYLTGGHGLSAGTGVDGSYSTDRGLTNGIVEDFGNQDQLQPFADHLLRAGGTVAALRPIGHQPVEVVVDNDSAGVTFSGSWSNATTGLHYDEDYGAVADAVAFRFAGTNGTTETASATYTPDLPSAGFYPVYTWATAGANRAVQTYQVNHSGGATLVNVDHRQVGGGWVYLGTYHFEAGSAGSVKITNLSTTTTAGAVVIADTIRFGNGMGDWNPGTGVSGRAREDEVGLYWIIRSLGTGTTSATRQVSNYDTGTDSSANISAQPKFAVEMNRTSTTDNPFGRALYISFHSNAGGGRGAVGLWNNPTTGTGGTTNQQRLALLLGKEMNEDMRLVDDTSPEGAWSTRTSYVYDDPSIGYGEISTTNAGGEMDATIIETAFHDDATDANFMKSVSGRDAMARATVQGVVRYFNEFSASPLQFAPSVPTGVRVTSNTAGDLTVRWTAPAADTTNTNRDVNTGANGYAATSYDVLVSRNGYGFAPLAQNVTSTTYAIPAADLDGGTYYFRIVARNAGGESAGSVVVGGRKNGTAAGGGANRVLVVNGFDRVDSSLSPAVSGSIVFNPPSTGTAISYTRVRPRLANSLDFVVQAGEAIEAYAGGGGVLGFDSVQNESLTSGAVSLANYQTVIWLSGQESTFDETFSAAEQTLVTSYLTGGGRLFVSGSEIGWDLDRATGPTTGDRSFYNGSLRTDYVSDDAGTYVVSPVAGGIFAGLSNVSFDSRMTIYDAQFPDVIQPMAGSGATVALNYSGGLGGGAAVQWSDAGNPNGARVVSFAFPFETIASATDRAAVMGRVLDFFQTAGSVAPGTPVLAAGSDTGASNADGITRLNNAGLATRLEFSVPGTVAGATVRLFSGTELIGTAVATGATTVVLTDGVTPITDGVRSITATQQEPGKGASVASGAVSVTVDTTAPAVASSAVNAGAAQRSKVTRLGVVFAERVITLADAFEVRRRSDALAAGVLVANASGDGRDYALTFAGAGTEGTSGSLAEGVWDLTALAGRISDVAGNAPAGNFVLTLHRLFGDGNGDRTVDSADVAIFTPHFGTTAAVAGGAFAGWFDFDDNGAVNNLDLLRLRQRTGVTYVY